MSSERHFVTLITTIAAIEVSDTIHLLCRKRKRNIIERQRKSDRPEVKCASETES